MQRENFFIIYHPPNINTCGEREDGMEPKKDTITELIETLSRFTPEQIRLFQSAAQRIVEQTQARDVLRKSEQAAG